MIKLFIPIRNVQNGDKIKLVGFQNNAYTGSEGIVADVNPLIDNCFTIIGDSSILVCSGRNYWGYTPGVVYEMNGKKYRCMKTQTIPNINQ